MSTPNGERKQMNSRADMPDAPTPAVTAWHLGFPASDAAVQEARVVISTNQVVGIKAPRGRPPCSYPDTSPSHVSDEYDA
jgi:hypothetical protein